MMADVKPPFTAWAIIKFDPTINEKRIVDIYLDPDDANRDAAMFGPAFVEVEPFLIHQAQQYGHDHEPAYEETADDFDTPIHVSGEVTQ